MLGCHLPRDRGGLIIECGMNAAFEMELAALSVQEKAEVIDLLLPDVLGEDGRIPQGVMAELERRDAAHEADPSGAQTLCEFDLKWFGGGRCSTQPRRQLAPPSA